VKTDAPTARTNAPAEKTVEATSPAPVDAESVASAGGAKAGGLQKKSSRRGIRLKGSANIAPDIDSKDRL
jgi:hypothetical protein